MAKTMILRSVFIACFALISLCEHPLTEASINGFTTELIHRDSPQSPSFNPSLSPSQRIVNALKRSFTRLHRFNTKLCKQLPQPSIIHSGGEYLIKYSVGTPPVPSLGVADTGSDVIWTQCQPCKPCFNQTLPLFKPKNSLTYRKISCNSTSCNSLPEITYCGEAENNCLYSELFADLSSTDGEFATETFALVSTNSKSVPIPNIMFGCGFRNSGTFSGTESGVVGLGGGKASLVRQLGQGKFSYCLISFSDHHSNSSKLNFGANAIVSGRGAVSTPLVKKEQDTFYYLTLEGISVGKQRLEFYDNSSSDSGLDREGNIIIDSGTTLTSLPAGLYAKMEGAIKNLIKLKQIKDPEGMLNLCYFSRKDIKIPEITVHFRGADVKLKQENVFVRTSDVSMCLAVLPADDPIYGNLAQINFLVGYDLEKRIVSFKPTDCGKF